MRPSPIPDELVLLVLEFQSPREVISLRLVSKQFNIISRDPRLWRTLYDTARLPRPPGPFLWQSTRYLERILIQSERLARTWTSQPISAVSCIQGPRLPGKEPTDSLNSNVLFGKLFVWYDEVSILVQDVETGIRQVVWSNDLQISSLSARSVSTPDGLRAVLALRTICGSPESEQPDSQLRLLVFSIEDDVSFSFGPLIYETNLPPEVNPPLSTTPELFFFDGGMGGAWDLPVCTAVIDPRTYALYGFPPSQSGPPLRGEDDESYPDVSLSGKYAVSVRHIGSLGTLVQVCTVPDQPPPANGLMGELRLTHEKVTFYGGVPSLVQALRDPILYPATGSTTLRFLGCELSDPPSHTYILCIDFTLPATDPNSNEALPLSFNVQELFILDGDVASRNVLVEASSDGYVRGFLTSSPRNFILGRTEHYKFSVDASGEICTAKVTDGSSTVRFGHSYPRVFDAVRGRVGYDAYGKGGRRTHLEVLDLR